MAKVKFSNQLKDEYEVLFTLSTIRPQHAVAVDAMLAKLLQDSHMARYRDVERQTGVPAHVVAVIHAMEASGRFDGHLHNGDPLVARTVQQPSNRPRHGEPPFDWVASAVDALALKGLDEWTDWSVPGIAYVLENYNGWGYRLFHPHVKSPYLWSFTTAYGAGKYVADGDWSDTAVSRQCGALALLKRMSQRGHVALPVRTPPDDAGEAAATPFPDPAAVQGTPPPYPGHVLKLGSSGDAVATLQRRLLSLGLPETGGIDGDLGERTERACRIFQARSVDEAGVPLEIDGVVGPVTWAALFGPGSVPRGPEPARPAAGSLAEAALGIAMAEIGVLEQPPGSNRGDRVDGYLQSVAPTLLGQPWCMAFVHFCFAEAARLRGVSNTAPRTASVWGSWKAAQGNPAARVVLGRDARSDPSLIEPGMVFHIDTGGGTGHAGFVVGVVDGRLVTIEGNTNDNGSRDGIGVFTRASRSIGSIDLGFVAYG